MRIDIPFPPLEPVHAREMRRRWIFGAASLAAAAAGLGLMFSHAVAGAVHVWLTSTAYNHCLLIIPISLYMAWKCRPALRGLEPEPEFRALALTVPLSALWLLAAMFGILEFQQFVAVATFQAIAFAILGRRIFRVLLGPLLFLFFLVPTGQILVPWLQNFSAHFVVTGLRFTGVPVFADGVTIQIPEGTFVVAEACAGLRFLVASVAFGVFFSWLVYRSVWRRLAFIALSIFVPIVANGLRCYGILIVAHLMGSAKAVMADHIIYGWGFFSVVTILLILIGISFADRPEFANGPIPSAAPRATPSGIRPEAMLLAALLGLIGAALGPAYAAVHSPP
jgi:exosortase A